MATKIIHKKSSVASSVPSSGDLSAGELAVNLADQKIYSKTTGGTVIEMAPVYDKPTSSTAYFQAPVGTTGQRPTAAVGMIRYNTTRGCFEGYTGSGWVNISPLTVGDVGGIV